MTSLEVTADPMESEDDQTSAFTEKVNQIIGQPLEISSLTLAESTMFSELKVTHTSSFKQLATTQRLKSTQMYIKACFSPGDGYSSGN